MIETKNVSKNYAKTQVLTECSLALPEQKMIAFIGPNGAGKSTLLSLVSRMLDQRTGDIYLDGTEIRQWKSKELAKKMAFLQQSNRYAVKLTVRELVAFGRYPYNRGRQSAADDRIIDDSLAKLSLTEYANQSIHELSGGQLQRVYLAMILAQDTDYLLLDEPLNNLDLKHANQLMKLLTTLVEDYQKTVVIVLHDINFAARYADHIVAMKDGQIFKAADTEAVIQEQVLASLYEIPIKLVQVDSRQFCYTFQ
ncbi:iron ABC transporter ATP-binding protein [Enterococcus casseliflavus]|uniref:iron ABC transporter ATP-binding protein n=1 Tax=Enterococcus casseliflavus TaxID=37734 RepID=UPI001CD1DB1D|nr:ATP-binding cassette domain-containing protein [Enterococcus casseliflavus]